MAQTDVAAIALGMLRRYSTPKKAGEMAWLHACDYQPGTVQYEHWRAVDRAIATLIASGWTRETDKR